MEKQIFQQYNIEEANNQKKEKVLINKEKKSEILRGANESNYFQSKKIKFSSYEKYEFTKPTIISFLGIPNSGKSTITGKLSTMLNSHFYLEPERNEHPSNIREKIFRIKELNLTSEVLHVFRYFRDIRVKNLLEAREKKIKGISSVIDSFFDKIMIDILRKKNTDYFINSKCEHFKEILKIAEEDSLSLPNIDLLFFLKFNSKELYNNFCLLKRKEREIDKDSEIYNMQSIFLETSINYSKQNSVKLIIIEQRKPIEDVVREIIFFLKKENLIKLID